MNLLTASRIKVAHACPRAHHYRYELGLKSHRVSPALAFGSAIHAGLEAWWSDPDHELASALIALDRADLEPFDKARAEAMLAAYDARWRRWALGTEVLGVEVEFRAPLREPGSSRAARTWQLAGKLDGLIRLADGRVAVLEHKSTSRDAGAGSEYRTRLTLDPQVSVYHDGADALGYPADLVLYDVLVKPTQKPLTASQDLKLRKDGQPRAGQRTEDETPEEYRERLLAKLSEDPERSLIHAEIVRTERDRAEHTRDVWETVAALEHYRARLPVLPPRHANACFAHGSPCAFLPLCEGRARVEDYARGAAHAELNTAETV